ncbi:MAG: type II secretion system F family protein [Synergistetes bacterium]|nr:MAG: General secretion pathway protein F [bacterium 42_11]MBC7332179.1 type II secretion system F family protein [Synergistota bacterium]
MAVFEYQAYGKDGKGLKGVIEAESRMQALSRLKKEGLIVVELKETRKVERKKKFTPKKEEVLNLAYGLGAHLRAGIPLIEALNILIEQTPSKAMKDALLAVRNDVAGGKRLYESLSYHLNLDESTIGLIRVGEESGSLDEVFERIAELREREIEVARKITGALVYPIIMLLVGIGVISFLLAFVVPKIVNLFTESGARLPLITRVLLFITSLFNENGTYILLAVLLLLLFLKLGIRSPRIRKRLDSLKLKIPFFSRVHMLYNLFLFCETLGVMLTSGMNILRALEIAKEVFNNYLFKSAVERAIEDIKEGKKLALSLRASGIFPPDMVYLIALGEESGELERSLKHLAINYNRSLSSSLTKMTNAFEPLMILALGGVVGFIVIAILLPIFELSRLVR